MPLRNAVLAAFLLPFLGWNTASDDAHTFEEPIDALSVGFTDEGDSAQVSYFANGLWSKWETLTVENEQDPLLKESQLMVFPEKIDRIRIKSEATIVLHPISISDAPVRHTVASINETDPPRIISREAWGADDSLLYRTSSSSRPSQSSSTAPSGDNGEAAPPSQRVKDCEEAQLNYPQEFRTKNRQTKNEDGKTYRWTREYSRDVKILAVHHTAVQVNGDKRSGAERVRALYAYHANNRGWGDVGYHYLVDEDGKIYEGKSGGKFVVGGHAYCNNIGTIGIALLGNFDVEKPTQNQLKALQWLLEDLAETYDIDLDEQVTHHGKKMEPIVGHRDLVSTDCPGYYVYGSLSQIRNHAASGNVYASVKLPKTLVSASSKSSRRTVTGASSSVSGGVSRRIQRLLDSQASKNLRRKIGSNPGREIESGTAARRAARLRSASASSRRSVSSRTRSTPTRPASGAPSPVGGGLGWGTMIRIRLSRQETGAATCDAYNLSAIMKNYRGSIDCMVIDGVAALINTVSLEDYMAGLAEEPDTEPWEKQRAFAIAARTYAAHYADSKNRKFPGKPYDGDDSPARFQMYGGIAFEKANPRWVEAVRNTAGLVLKKDGQIIRAPYFSADDGRTRTPEEAGWNNFPFAEVFTSKDDPWCKGETLRGHGVGMSGCGSEGQANEGKTAEEILWYYYPGTVIEALNSKHQ